MSHKKDKIQIVVNCTIEYDSTEKKREAINDLKKELVGNTLVSGGYAISTRSAKKLAFKV